MQALRLYELCILPASGSGAAAGTQTPEPEAQERAVATARRRDKEVQAAEPEPPALRGGARAGAAGPGEEALLAALDRAYAVLVSSAPERARVTAFLSSLQGGPRAAPRAALVDVGALFRDELRAAGEALAAARGEPPSPAPPGAVYRHYARGRLVYALGKSIYYTPGLWLRDAPGGEPALVAGRKQTLYASPFASAGGVTVLKAHPTRWKILALGGERGDLEIVLADFAEGQRRALAATGSATPLSHGSPVLLLEWIKVDANTVGLLSASRNGRVLVWRLAEQEGRRGLALAPVAGCSLLARTRTKLCLGRELTSACYCTVGVSLSTATLLASSVEGQVMEFSFSLRRETPPGSLDALADPARSGLRVVKRFATAPNVRKVTYLDPQLVEAGVRDGCSTATVLAARSLMLLLSGRGDICLVDGAAAAASGAAAGGAILRRYVLPDAQGALDFVTASRYLVALTPRDSLAVFDLGRASAPAVQVDLRARGFRGGLRLQPAGGVSEGDEGRALVLHVVGEELSLIIEVPLPGALQTDRGFLEGLVAGGVTAEALAG